MKRLLPLLALPLLLVACGSETLSFRMSFDTDDALRREELVNAARRVIEGRMAAKQKEALSQEIKTENGETILTVTVSDAEAAEHLQSGLTTPFSMAIMKQVPAGQGDIINEKFGEFDETGITTEDFDWVEVGDVTGGTASVRINFTAAGKAELKKLFVANRGQTIGIFVRGQLMGKKLIDRNDTQESIAVDGIPNASLAASFADDVNTGLHVTFTPLP